MLNMLKQAERRLMLERAMQKSSMVYGRTTSFEDLEVDLFRT